MWVQFYRGYSSYPRMSCTLWHVFVTLCHTLGPPFRTTRNAHDDAIVLHAISHETRDGGRNYSFCRVGPAAYCLVSSAGDPWPCMYEVNTKYGCIELRSC